MYMYVLVLMSFLSDVNGHKGVNSSKCPQVTSRFVMYYLGFLQHGTSSYACDQELV